MNTRLNIDDLRRVAAALPAELAPLREAAIASLDEKGLPTVRHEDWKYTDLAPAIETSNHWLAAGADRPDVPDSAILAAIESIDAHWIVIANGTPLVPDIEDDSVTVQNFSNSSAPFVLEHSLAELNAALLVDGVRIDVRSNPQKPIGILVIDSADETPVTSQSCVEISVAENTAAEFIEYHVSSGSAAHYANSVIGLHLGAGSHVAYQRIQNRAQHHLHTSTLSVVAGKDAELHMQTVDTGGQLVRNSLDIDIAAPGASMRFDGLFLLADKQHIDNHTRVDHRVGPAVSKQEYRGILSGRCRGVWNGKAIVHEGADGTDAEQANHNLLLSPHAEIDAKPELEIYTDEVRASHGTTVGQLDERALFYLRSRGIGETEALQMLTRGFANQVTASVPVAAAADTVDAIVAEKLATMVAEDGA